MNMFGHPSQHGHMMSGVAAAAKSSKTPAHLKPHLEARMKMFKGKPITGATRPQNSPQAVKQGAGGPAAQSQIAGPPMPFQNKMNSANFQRGRVNSAAMKGIGTGKSANSANVSGQKAPAGVSASPGNPFPKKRFPPSGKSKFYGG